MTEEERAQREAVVRIARQWIGLPYRDNARIRGVCGDCTFAALVYEDAGLIPHVAIADYSPQAHLHRTGGLYIGTVKQYAHEVEAPQIGDLVLYYFGRDYSHGGVIVHPGWPSIIHGDREARFIIEANGEYGRLASAKDRKFFSFWNEAA